MRINLRVKFAFLIVAIIFLTVFLLGYFITREVKVSLEKEIAKKSKALMENLLATSKEAILTNDDLNLVTTIDTIKKDPSVIYAVVTDENNKVIAHSDLNVRKGKIFKNSNIENSYMITEPIKVNSETIGYVKIAFSKEEIKETVGGITKVILGITGVLMIFGVIFSIVAITFITEPIKILSNGAKIIGGGNLKHRINIKSNDELGDLAKTFNETTLQLEKAQEIKIEQEKIKHELKIAKEIQDMLLPKETPKVSSFEFATLYKSAKEIGGDYFDFFWIDKRRIGIVIADVAGKGIPGSLGMSITRNILRAQAVSHGWPSYVLAKTNALLRNELKKGIFVTMFYCILDIKERSLICSNAGHHPMLLFRANNNYEVIDPPGLALGFADTVLFENTISDVTVQLEINDLMMLYSDGVYEATNPKKEEFGEKQMIEVIKNNLGEKAEYTVKQLEKELLEFTGTNTLMDDVTVVAMKAV